MTPKQANDWNYRKMIGIGLALIAATLAILITWWAMARRAPRCSSASWWPKKALGKKSIKAGKAVLEAYVASPGDTGAGFGLPSFEYWTATTHGSYRTWVYTQMVIEYLVEGGVSVPDDFPPCVFEPSSDCAVCKELRSLSDALDAAIKENPAVGVASEA